MSGLSRILYRCLRVICYDQSELTNHLLQGEYSDHAKVQTPLILGRPPLIRDREYRTVRLLQEGGSRRVCWTFARRAMKLTPTNTSEGQVLYGMEAGGYCFDREERLSGASFDLGDRILPRI